AHAGSAARAARNPPRHETGRPPAGHGAEPGLALLRDDCARVQAAPVRGLRELAGMVGNPPHPRRAAGAHRADARLPPGAAALSRHVAAAAAGRPPRPDDRTRHAEHRGAREKGRCFAAGRRTGDQYRKAYWSLTRSWLESSCQRSVTSRTLWL